MQGKTKTVLIVILILVFTLSSFRVLAQPTGPNDIDRGPSERATTQTGIAQEAQAGNVTPLSITAVQITQRWQGFYGNVSGNMTLDDAAGNTMYQWEVASPQGEVYAVNSSDTPIWDQVMCFNFTADTNQNVTLSELEGALGMGTHDVDGVNETFNISFTGNFQVGTTTIDENSGCKAVSLNVNDQQDQLSFNETILTDNTSSESVIYVALLEQDAVGFKTGGETADFQMIVGENGDVTETTTYTFYVELT